MEIAITRHDGIVISANLPNDANVELVSKYLTEMLVATGYSRESIAKYIEPHF